MRVPHAVAMSEELKLEWLIPTLQGPGLVTVAMLDLLVGSHKDFIEKSQGILKRGQKEQSEEMRRRTMHCYCLCSYPV